MTTSDVLVARQSFGEASAIRECVALAKWNSGLDVLIESLWLETLVRPALRVVVEFSVAFQIQDSVHNDVLMSEWFLQQNGQVSGAFTFDELAYLARRGGVNEHDMIRSIDSSEWMAAEHLDGLFDARLADESSTLGEQGETQENRITQPNRGNSAPPPIPARDEERERTTEKMLAGIVGGILVLLLLLLALWLFWPSPYGAIEYAGRGNGLDSNSQNAGGNASGKGNGNASSTTSGNQNQGTQGFDSQQKDSAQGDDSAKGARSVKNDSSSSSQARDSAESDASPLKSSRDNALFHVPELAQPSAQAQGAGSQGTVGGGDETERTIAGVKVKGSLALVCDISGSMREDFPILYRELRSKFPENTPIILVNGCSFRPAGGRQPYKVQGVSMEVPPYAQATLAGDKYVYYADNTTDAIIYGVSKLRRRTVMFNNDLQDGGSLRALDALEAQRKRRRFTLAGRSLNCDAPAELKEFIEKTGGEFKVDPIGRSIGVARRWGP